MDHIVLGIDPGSLIMGYSILAVRDDRPSLVTMDVLYLKKIDDYNQRIRAIFDNVISIIDTHHPDHLAIEAPFFGKNVQSMLKLGRAQGVAIAAAMSRDIPFTEYEPAVIKQYITGNGNATKEQVARMLQMQLAFTDEPKYLDATDALAAAYCHFLQLTHPMAALHQQLKAKTHRTKSRRQQWSDFLLNNPDKIQK